MANVFYSATGNPGSGSEGLSALMRGEFLNVQAGFDLVTADFLLKADATNGVLTNPTITTPTITGGTLDGTPVGGSTASTGAFTSLSAGGAFSVTGAVSGAGFTNLFSSPPPIGSVAAGTGAFTTLSAAGAVSGAGISALFSSPASFGSVAPNAGAFTTLSASGAVSGAGIVALFSSPASIGNVTPAAGAFTTLSSSGATLIKGGTLTLTPSAGFGIIDAGTGTLLLKSGSTGSNGLIQAFSKLQAPTLLTTGTLIWSGVPDNSSTAQPPVIFKYDMSGTLTSGQQRLVQIVAVNDTVVTPGVGGAFSLFGIDHATQAGAVGNRWGIDVATNVGDASTNLAIGGIRQTAVSSFNMGGTGIDSAGLLSNGTLFAGNDVVQANSGATFLKGIVGREIDVSVATGASVSTKFGLAITQLSTDRVQGTYDDAAISFNNQGLSPPPGWKVLLSVGRFFGQSPMDPTNGWVMNFTQTGGVGTIAGAGGLDFTNFTPVTAFLQGNNFLLDPTGNFTANSLKVGANQVVGARNTGWTAMTGSPDKATAYATSTVTLAQLAGRVAQLQASLTTHGVIGA
jgi:hypothetical protein